MKLSSNKHKFLLYKKHLEQRLVDIMIDGYEKKMLNDDDIKKIARLVLEHIDRIKNHDEIIGFLGKLSLKWPLFTTLAQSEEGKLKSAIEKKTAMEVLKLISNNEIGNAIKLAHSVTN